MKIEETNFENFQKSKKNHSPPKIFEKIVEPGADLELLLGFSAKMLFPLFILFWRERQFRKILGSVG